MIYSLCDTNDQVMQHVIRNVPWAIQKDLLCGTEGG